MSGYFRMSADEWEPEHYKGRWSPENKAPRWWAFADASWYIDRRRLPAARTLAAEWGWSKSMAYDFAREVVMAQLEWEKRADERAYLLTLLPAPDKTRTPTVKSAGQAPDNEAPTNADNVKDERTNDGQTQDTFRTNGGHLTGADLDPASSAASTSSQTQDAAAPAAPSEMTRSRTADEDTLYAAYRGFRPRIPPTPTPDTRKHLRRILTEAGGIEPAGLYLAWTFQSQDERALQVQGKAPWPGGKVNPMLSLEELGRHIGSRMPMAEAWDARGRRNGPQAPPGQAPRPTRGTLASELFADDPDPAPRPNAINTTWSEA
jgi:hypothetical protein